MNKIIIGILAVVIIIGAIFLFKPKSEVAPISEENSNVTKGVSIKELLAENKSQKCTFKDATPAAENSGTVFFDKGEMRGDFVSVTGDETFNSHMILKGDSMYVWVDSESEGFQVKASTMNEANTLDNESPDLDKKVDYRCEDWNADSNTFTLPSIKFNDMSATINTRANLMPN